MDKVSTILSLLKNQKVTDEALLSKFEEFAVYMAEENEKINITSITDPVGIALKHFCDSLSLLRLSLFDKENLRVADIGCGGGFPGLVLGLARPDLRLVMVDSTEKKIKYVQRTAEKFGISNVQAISARAEELVRDDAMREKFDVVTSRAVARLAPLTELCMPYVRVGGYFVPMKAAETEEELKEAKRAITTLGGKIEEVVSVEFDFDISDTSLFDAGEMEKIKEFSTSKRSLIVVRKTKRTPDIYPRAWAKIIKKPL